MRRSIFVLALGLVIAVFGIAAIACDDNGDDGDSDPTATAVAGDPTEPAGDPTEPADEPTEPAGEAGATVIVTENAGLGSILTDAEGNTVYIFTVDEPGVSNCADACVDIWPPLTADGDPTAGEGVPGTLGTIERADGTTQVTYDDAPLYYYSLDEAAGDTNGQGVADIWFVVEIE